MTSDRCDRDPRDLLGGESSRQPPEIGTYRHHCETACLEHLPPPAGRHSGGVHSPPPARCTGHPLLATWGWPTRRADKGCFGPSMLRPMAKRATPLAKAPSSPNICRAAIKWVITVPPAKRIIRRRLTTTTTTTRLGWPQEINFGRTKRDKNTPILSDFDPQARLGWIAPRSAVF